MSVILLCVYIFPIIFQQLMFRTTHVVFTCTHLSREHSLDTLFEHKRTSWVFWKYCVNKQRHLQRTQYHGTRAFKGICIQRCRNIFALTLFLCFENLLSTDFTKKIRASMNTYVPMRVLYTLAHICCSPLWFAVKCFFVCPHWMSGQAVACAISSTCFMYCLFGVKKYIFFLFSFLCLI